MLISIARSELNTLVAIIAPCLKASGSCGGGPNLISQIATPSGELGGHQFGGNATYFAPDASGMLLAEDQTSVGAWLDYVWLNGRLVAVLTSTGGLYPTDTDQTGRPVVMTNWFNQAVSWQAQGFPFTRTVSTGTWFSMNLGFPGQYLDAESGQWHNGNRDYDSASGRYIEPDPLGLGGGINPYVYAENNPISNVDPLGLCDQCKDAGNAPSPQAYQALGEEMKWTSILGGVFGAELNLGALYQFHRGGALDAQAYGALPDYANYVYGVEMAANGIPLGAALGAANEYANLRSSYPSDVPMDPNYPSTPAVNVSNITQGYNDQKNGTLCTVGGR